MDILISKQAYCKMVLHLCKYPHASCNGLLLSKVIKNNDENSSKREEFVDCIPLFHSVLSLAPSLEVALWQIDSYCEENNLKISGYYQANQNVDDKKPNLIAFKIMEKLKEQCDSFLFMIDNNEIFPLKRRACYDIYNIVDQKLVEFTGKHQVENNTVDFSHTLIKSKIYKKLNDFDDHLDNISLDWKNLKLNKLIEK